MSRERSGWFDRSEKFQACMEHDIMAVWEAEDVNDRYFLFITCQVLV